MEQSIKLKVLFNNIGEKHLFGSLHPCNSTEWFLPYYLVFSTNFLIIIERTCLHCFIFLYIKLQDKTYSFKNNRILFCQLSPGWFQHLFFLPIIFGARKICGKWYIYKKKPKQTTTSILIETKHRLTHIEKYQQCWWVFCCCCLFACFCFFPK